MVPRREVWGRSFVGESRRRRGRLTRRLGATNARFYGLAMCSCVRFSRYPLSYFALVPTRGVARVKYDLGDVGPHEDDAAVSAPEAARSDRTAIARDAYRW